MSVFIPTAAAGNGKCLATFGRTGELMGFFYPRIDYAQNIREAMPALRIIDGPNAGQFLWCFDDAWEITQSFAPANNVLTTRLRHRHMELALEIRDAVPADSQVLLRHARITKGPEVGQVQFVHYFRLALGDVDYRNGIQAHPEQNNVIQHFRNIAIAVSATTPFGAQCGSLTEPGDTQIKQAMVAGQFGSSPQSIGRVDFAVGFEPATGPEWETTLVLAGGTRRQEAADRARDAAAAGFEAACQSAQDRTKAELADAGHCPIPELADGFERAVISLHDLYDANMGTFIAAPEFDLGYELSGGYGYCWPRDAAVCALALQRIGRTDMARRFFDWSAKTQLENGHWFQRYWTDGSAAPSWCVHADQIQLDQTCAIVHAAGQFARRLPDEARDKFVQAYRPVAEKATAAILRHLNGQDIHGTATDLWENSVGSFAYTQAGVVAAFREAHEVFHVDGESTGPQAQARLRDKLIEAFWQTDRKQWLRRITPEGHPDPTLDSSAMGIIDPWEVLRLDDAADRQLARETIEGISRDLRSEVKGGGAILRFQNESYMGGGPGCVNTLWLAVCRLRLAATASLPAERDADVEKAVADLRIALANTSPTGQLPELIPKINGFEYWAAPHAWACSLLIEAVAILRAMHDKNASVFDHRRAEVRRQAPTA